MSPKGLIRFWVINIIMAWFSLDTEWKRLVAGVTIIGTLLGIYSELPAIGINPPRLAWYSDVQALHKEVVSTRITLYGALQTREQFSLARVLNQQQTEYITKGLPVPIELLKEETNLRDQLDETTTFLDSYRKEYATLENQ